MLSELLTKCSDYMANDKIPKKDIAVINEFLEPFKWDQYNIESLCLDQYE